MKVLSLVVLASLAAALVGLRGRRGPGLRLGNTQVHRINQEH